VQFRLSFSQLFECGHAPGHYLVILLDLILTLNQKMNKLLYYLVYLLEMGRCVV